MHHRRKKLLELSSAEMYDKKRLVSPATNQQTVATLVHGLDSERAKGIIKDLLQIDISASSARGSMGALVRPLRGALLRSESVRHVLFGTWFWYFAPFSTTPFMPPTSMISEGHWIMCLSPNPCPDHLHILPLGNRIRVSKAGLVSFCVFVGHLWTGPTGRYTG